MKRKLRAYFVDGDWDRGTGFAVIAHSAREAKKMNVLLLWRKMN